MADLLELAESDPRTAIRQARDQLERSASSNPKRAQAHRAIGLALRTLGDAPGSIQALELARDAAQLSGEQQLIGEVELTLGASVAFAGDLERAFGLLDQAEGRLDQRGRAHVLVQRAGLIARSGDFARCLPMYAEAETILEDHDDDRWLALLGANRGLVYTYSGQYGAARRDLEKSRRLYEATGSLSSSAEMTHNLGFLALREGDIPATLAAIDEAERRFGELGIPLSELILDRAEALMMVGLASEAVDVAGVAVETLQRAGLDIEKAEALVVQARAALAARDFETAMAAGDSAAEVMAAQERPGWELRARYLSLAAAVASGAPVKRRQLTDLGLELASKGQLFAAYHCRLLAGQVALRQGELDAAERELTEAGTVPDAAPVDVRIQAWLARAMLHNSRGDVRSASAAAAAGVRLLEGYRATFGATESRVNVARHAAELFELGIELAAISGRPSSLLAWSERARTGALQLIRPRPPQDAELAQALADLRVAQLDIREAEMDGDFASGMWSEQSALERRVRRLSLRQRGDSSTMDRLPPLRDLQAQLQGRALVAFIDVGGTMYGLRVRRGSIRSFELGATADVTQSASELTRAHRAGVLPVSQAMAAANRQRYERSALALDAMLLAPLRVAGEDLVIVPPPALHALPWPALPSCRGRSTVIAPSAYAWYRASTTPSLASGRVLLVAGPDLEQAEGEIDQLAGLYDDPLVLTGPGATVESVTRALGEVDVAHFACHAVFRSDNAMFSSLILADGNLTVYDIEQAGRSPGVVVLSACDSGLSDAAAGEELMGLSTALIGMGTRSLIAATAPVPDAEPVRRLMAMFHSGLLSGRSAAESVLDARLALTGGDRLADVTRDAFFCFGS